MARFAVFNVELLASSDTAVSVDYQTVPGTAVESDDYTPMTGTLYFAPGETSKQVRVPVRETDDAETENFTLLLSNPRKARLQVAEGVAELPGSGTGLAALFPNRNLGVLFYAGEKHPGDGPEASDTEWVLAPGEARFQADDSLYAGVFGQFTYNLGGPVLVAGGGAIELLSGYWLHYLCQDNGAGATVVQVLFNDTDTMQADQSLQPENVAALTAWWDSTGRKDLQLLDASDNVVALLPLSFPSNDPMFDPDVDGPVTSVRKGSNTSVPWTPANLEAVVKMRIVPFSG